jgi:hypothetical protein
MSTCVARKGFLTLSDCGATAVRPCANCGRSMCSTHLSAQSGFTKCLDCSATAEPETAGQYDDLWARRYRNTYYTTTGFLPVYGASRLYDQSDSRSFDGGQADLLEDDVEGGRFRDS